MKLKQISTFYLSVLYLLAATLLVLWVNHQMKASALHQAEETAMTIVRRSVALHWYMDEVMRPKIMATLEPDGILAQNDPTWMSSIHVAREIDRVIGPQESGTLYREVSINSRNPENEASAFEKGFLARLNADPALQKEVVIRSDDGMPLLSLIHRGRVMKEECLLCHGHPQKAPLGFIENYGEKGFHRKPGEVISAIAVDIPLAVPFREANRYSLQHSAALLSILLGLYLLQRRILQRLFFAPLQNLQAQFHLIASKPEHLGKEVSYPRLEEFRDVAHAFNLLSRRLREQRDGLELTVASRTAEQSRMNAQLQHDIEQRRTIEGELRTSRNSLQALIDASPLPIIAYREGKRVEIWNRAAGKIFGWGSQEAIGSEASVIPFAPRDELLYLWKRASQGDIVSNREVMGQRKDGTLFPLAVHGAPIRHGGERIDGIMLVLEDISERRTLEISLRQKRRELKALSEEFEAVLQGIPDSLALVSKDRHVKWANRGTSELLGLESDPAGRRCGELFCRGDYPCAECPVARAFLSGRIESGKLSNSDGRTWGIKAFPLVDQKGSTRQVLRWGGDITEQLRIQESAMQASRLASLGELAAGVAHEINNPNGLILLNSHLLRDVFDDLEPLLEEHFQAFGDYSLGGLKHSRLRQELPHILSETIEAADRIKRIVEDLKSFARQETIDNSESIDLNSAVQTAVRLSRSSLDKHTDRLCIALADDLPPLTGNQQRLEQVVINLLMNACQALADRSKGITLETRRKTAGDAVELVIKDEGTGIPPDIMPHLTTPFFTTRRTQGGTGLGIPISCRIAKEHGGDLRFDSTPGHGTTVTLTLPIKKEPSLS